jgi:hypothetical protein
VEERREWPVVVWTPERERGRGACMILEPMEKRVKLVRG